MTELVYCCRKCRQVLFAESNVSTVPHEGGIAFDTGKRKECTSHFLLEPEPYMKQEGKLACPKCDTRFGTFVWAGSQCSCGFWCVPAIQIPKSKVDFRRQPAATQQEGIQ